MQNHDKETRYLLQYIQPALLGLMDGSVSTLAPLFAAAQLTGSAWQAFVIGFVASLGAGISMGLSEAVSDDGAITGRGGAWMRGAITGFATFIGGMLHTLPFLLSNLTVALTLATAVVIVELGVISWIKFRFMKAPLGKTALQVMLGGVIVFVAGVWMGNWGAGH